ncbi:MULTISPECIES: RNA recognition motif domain-containing protein [Maribellus]|uniref:RNA-binding protein n=1 Tax=Maribellus comscasis TaxID=2681766 RepID=A0A6I6K1C7_9BACT|nr:MULTISPECIES: RNA-binding protein [Maribellus]MCG6189928.1 RNA-binding protein [Maribellus maritimus]QGY46222.1 RNA-binding protein [Maribellus comscasis]
MNLFVAKLSSSTTGDDLQELFSQFGEVASAKVIFDRETGNSKGFGFVEMPNDDEANEAINALNESEQDGNQIVVKQANPRTENRSGGRGFGGQHRGGFQNRGGGGGFQRRDDRRGGGGGGRRFDNRGRGGGGGYSDRENDRY